MRGWDLIQHLRGLVGLADGEAASAEHAERLLDVVEGVALEEEPELEAPFLYVYQNGRGVICAPSGWSRRIPDHDGLLEEVFHYLLAPFADDTCTVRGEVNGHRREERRASDHVLLWWLCHGTQTDDEELAAEAEALVREGDDPVGRPLTVVRKTE